jgi:hypothetical protein
MQKRILMLGLVALLAGCTLTASPTEKPPAAATNPIIGGEISTTSLEAAKPAAPTTKPRPRPTTAAPAAAPAAEPPPEPPQPPPLPPEAVACAKKGDKWLPSGKGGMSCIHFTRDSGKECRKQSQCEGLCLARSGTCAPVTPLFGCNEIFQDNGVMVTLCID